jgi:hypothetical protein
VSHARYNAFAVYYGVAYMALFFTNEFFQYSFFGYYPVIGAFSRMPLPLETSGPAILWYAWLLGALVISLALAGLTPRRVGAAMGRRAVWVVPVALYIVIFVYERRWFY